MSKKDMQKRIAAKAASRKRDSARLKKGEDPGVLQEENSVFPVGYFRGARISNLAKAVGR